MPARHAQGEAHRLLQPHISNLTSPPPPFLSFLPAHTLPSGPLLRYAAEPDSSRSTREVSSRRSPSRPTTTWTTKWSARASCLLEAKPVRGVLPARESVSSAMWAQAALTFPLLCRQGRAAQACCRAGRRGDSAGADAPDAHTSTCWQPQLPPYPARLGLRCGQALSPPARKRACRFCSAAHVKAHLSLLCRRLPGLSVTRRSTRVMQSRAPQGYGTSPSRR